MRAGGRITGLWLLVLLGLTGCGHYSGFGRGPDAAASLTVMTFNIRYGTADDGANRWSRRRGLVLDVIRQQAPDVLALQEALRFQLDELRDSLPGYGELGVGRDDGGVSGEYAAILYSEGRFEVASHGTFWLSETPELPGSLAWGAHVPRICTWARLRDRRTGRAFYLLNVHFDHESQESRERSAELLAEWIRRRRHQDPVIVAGDFNAGEDNRALDHLRGERSPVRLRDSFRILHPDAVAVGTYHGFRGDGSGPKIDGVLVSGDWEVEAAAIVRTSRSGRYPSDHFPVVATLRFSEN